MEIRPIYEYLLFFANLKAIPGHRIWSRNQRIHKRRKTCEEPGASCSAVHTPPDEREARIREEGLNARGAGYSIIHLASVNMSINRTALRFQARAL